MITSVAAFRPFFGTSAAAPHAAAIAGLVLSGNPGAGTADVREAFDATALDLRRPGVDGRTGRGIVRADRVLEYTGATPQPLVRAGTPTVTAAGGDGDAYLEPGETGTLTLPVTNEGDGTAGGVSVTASTPDPQVTITPRARSYGDIPARRDPHARLHDHAGARRIRSASASRSTCGSRSRACCRRPRPRWWSGPASPARTRPRSPTPATRSRSPTTAPPERRSRSRSRASATPRS